MKILLALSLALTLSGCSSTGVVTGEARSKFDPSNVKVYDSETAPKTYQVIGLVSSNNGMGGSGLGQLKRRAADMGANAVIVTSASNDIWYGGRMSGKAIFVDAKSAQ